MVYIKILERQLVTTLFIETLRTLQRELLSDLREATQDFFLYGGGKEDAIELLVIIEDMERDEIICPEEMKATKEALRLLSRQ